MTGGVNLKWEEPPKLRAAYDRWRPVLEALQSRPEQWARLEEAPCGSKRATTLRDCVVWLKGYKGKENGRGYDIPDGRFEFCTRTIPVDGTSERVVALFGRYLGPA